MKCSSFEEAVEQIVKEDPRYDREAYQFLREALDYAITALRKPRSGPERHLSGQELVEGIRLYALDEFGPVAKLVLTSWGITRTLDFGEIVFNLVDKGVLGKQDSDQKQDFADGFDFDEAFVTPFLPLGRRELSDTEGAVALRHNPGTN